MKKYFTPVIFIAVILAVGVVSMNLAAASSRPDRSLQKTKTEAALKALDDKSKTKRDMQIAERSAFDVTHDASSLEHQKKNELNRLDKELNKITLQNQRLASLSGSKNPQDVKSLSTLQNITKNNSSLTSSLNALKAKIQADATLDELDTDSNALTDLIAPAKQ